MKLVEKLLSEDDYTRPRNRKLKEKRAVILHWTGSPNQGALEVWNYFEHSCAGKTYASAHYCIDLDGTVYRFIPDDEVAYHCGSSQVDPRSGKVYTDWAREVFGVYAEDPERNSPNNAAIGIEMCVLDDEGNFSDETLRAAAELTAHLCKTYQVPLERVGTHNLVVGWKDCPRLWTRHPGKFEDFKKEVNGLLNE
jgi:N-acetylmuramoyl-L-alanine amidase